MDDKLDLLEGVPLFSGVSREGLEELGAIADELEVPAGTALTHEGYREGFFFIVVEGSVRISGTGCWSTPSDRATTWARSPCSTAARGRPRPRPRRPCRLLSLTYGMFHELLDASPSIRTAILEAVGQRLRELDDVGPV